MLTSTVTRLFDLNIEKVLDHWEPKHAVRELIANALDEQLLSGSRPIEITKSPSGCWRIHDFGRGVQIEHFTQNENPEKQNIEGVIGKFGVGLKDALATLNRHGILVSISSSHGFFRLTTALKKDYEEIWTLHISHEPGLPNVIGTEVVLDGVSDSAILEAKSYFLVFRPHTLLEQTQFGQILQKEGDGAAIFINGVWANSEPNFLFSYNVTSLTRAMRLSLNRERVNVGRSVYADRVRQILKLSHEQAVGDLLAAEFAKKAEGGLPDELHWVDISSRALVELGKRESIICLSDDEIKDRPELVEDMKSDGFKIVIINDKEKQRATEQATSGNATFHTLHTWVETRNDSFQYQFVEPSKLNDIECALFALTDQILALAGPSATKAPPVLISETMRNTDVDKTLGAWDPSLRAIVIRRTQLKSFADYAGTLLHELAHARSGATDCTRRFEFELTTMLGLIAQRTLKGVTHKSVPGSLPIALPARCHGPESWIDGVKFRSVDSSNVRAVGYDDSKQLLHVEFLNGGRYIYSNVPFEDYTALIEAPSIGRFLNARIIPKFQCMKSPV